MILVPRTAAWGGQSIIVAPPPALLYTAAIKSRRRVHGKPARKAVETVDPDRLLDGEDPQTPYVDDAQHWIEVYRELLDFKDRVLETADQELAQMGPQARFEVRDTDLVVLKAEKDRLRRRFDFWRDRHQELAAT